MLLKDKVIVITGSTKGIGKGIAMKAAQEGAKVVASGPEPELVKALEKEFADNNYTGIAVLCDVTKKIDVDNLMLAASKKYGKIDGLVACAGIIDPGHFEDIDEARWDKLMNVNLKGVYLADQAVIPYLKKNGGGKIINIGSDCSLEGWDFLTSYSASKFAVRGLSQALAKELGVHNIKVNVICPGIIETDMWEQLDKTLSELRGLKQGETWSQTVAKIPLGRGGKPEDLGNGAVLLLSDYSDYITGCSLTVGGGSAIH